MFLNYFSLIIYVFILLINCNKLRLLYYNCIVFIYLYKYNGRPNDIIIIINNSNNNNNKRLSILLLKSVNHKSEISRDVLIGMQHPSAINGRLKFYSSRLSNEAKPVDMGTSHLHSTHATFSPPESMRIC